MKIGQTVEAKFKTLPVERRKVSGQAWSCARFGGGGSHGFTLADGLSP